MADKALSSPDNTLWKRLIEQLETNDLESALQAIQLSDRLSDHVVEHTWKQTAAADAQLFERVIGDRNLLPLTRLYRHLFSSTNRTLSVVTPNYDRLAEYAADLAGFCHYTGFSYGYLRHRQSGKRLSFVQENRQARTIDIWKVHGCLDWFIDLDGQVVAVTSSRAIPSGYRPAIVTPGIEKYERTHLEPFRSIFAGADAALERATAYLCIGFGFNDAHIQPKLLERWRNGNAFLVILTKDLSSSAKSMLAAAHGQEFLALEEADTGTQMWSHHFPGGVRLEDIHLWRLSDFLDNTT